ncbi:hypothetical protein EON63_08670 [archaeon]|nr:MAG: hypothetical protein EON63_08670 [archaeon]
MLQTHIHTYTIHSIHTKHVLTFTHTTIHFHIQVIYIDGRSGWEGVQRCVDQREAVVGFALTRVTTQKIMQVADANLLLPPKVWQPYHTIHH